MKSFLSIKYKSNTLFTSAVNKSYHTHPVTYPTSLPKPMNPWDNMDPGRSDKSVVDEFDKINRKFNPGDLPPNAWSATRDFPEWYRPYLLNYNGNGYLMFFLLISGLCIYYQREQIKKIKGRSELKDYLQEKKNIYTPFKNANLLEDVRNNHKDPYINYLRRYIKESGF